MKEQSIMDWAIVNAPKMETDPNLYGIWNAIQWNETNIYRIRELLSQSRGIDPERLQEIQQEHPPVEIDGPGYPMAWVGNIKPKDPSDLKNKLSYISKGLWITGEGPVDVLLVAISVHDRFMISYGVLYKVIDGRPIPIASLLQRGIRGVLFDVRRFLEDNHSTDLTKTFNTLDTAVRAIASQVAKGNRK